jgi:electron transfer flavoprotein beta subunit
VIEAPLPALLTVLKEFGEIRYAALPEVIRGLRTKVPLWTAKDIDLDPQEAGLLGSPTQVRRIFAPPQRTGGEVLTVSGDADRVARDIIGRLLEAGVVGG